MGLDGQKLCMGCMKPLAWDGRCGCGFDRKSYPADSHYLPLGSLLKNGDYMVGKVLGEGGFGITYIGYDQNLLSRIAIKEYYPAGFAGRDVSNGSYEVHPYGTDTGEVYKKGLDAFLKEARVLAKFDDMEGIVKVHYFFQENGTAYIVMEYVEGISVKNYVKAYGRIPPDMVWKMMEQPIRALQAVHEKQMVHRDVSADNLMIRHNGKVTLIDFGAARSSNMLDEKTRTTICKQGFSALEQYSKEGKQGPWTDVYGICATMYYMLTGIIPKNSTERIVDDMVAPLNQMEEISLALEKKDALMTGMAVRQSERFQNMEALYAALYGESLEKQTGQAFDFSKEEGDGSKGKKGSGKGVADKEAPDKEPGNHLTALLGEVLRKRERKTKRNRRRKFLGKIAGGIFTVLFLVLIFGGMRGYIHIDTGGETNSKKPVSERGSESKSDYEPQPDNTPRADNEPQQGSTSQSSHGTQPDNTPQATASGMVKMPKVAGLKKAKAVEKLEKKGLRYKALSRYHNNIDAGKVIRASVIAGRTVEKGEKITLYVSKGKKAAVPPRKTITPVQTPVPTPAMTRRPTATKKPVATKKPNHKKDDYLAGDLDSILY